jgi:hypothetical protein
MIVNRTMATADDSEDDASDSALFQQQRLRERIRMYRCLWRHREGTEYLGSIPWLATNLVIYYVPSPSEKLFADSELEAVLGEKLAQ